MRILVTGAAGFLGSHFAEKYLNEGHEILAVDNFFTGKRLNIHHLIDNHNFEMLRHDITQPLIVEVDAIANFACPASPIQYQKYPVQTIKTSILGITNMLGLAKRLNIKLMQASTSEVYVCGILELKLSTTNSGSTRGISCLQLILCHQIKSMLAFFKRS